MAKIKEFDEATPNSVSGRHFARNVVASLPKLLPHVSGFTLAKYVPAPTVEERLAKWGHDDVVQMLAGSQSPDVLAKSWENKLVSELSAHDDRDEASREFQVAASDLSEDFLDSCIRRLVPGEVLALSSLCTLATGERAHLPLMDFRPAPSAAGLSMIQAACRALRLAHGVILTSGRSYHAYAYMALSPDAWWKLMIKAILLAPLVDVRYVAHRLLAGRAVLRITSTNLKPTEPEVVHEF